jgi:CRISPR-associated endoribonuclease Cas6
VYGKLKASTHSTIYPIEQVVLRVNNKDHILMSTAFSVNAPATLYALLLKLRPLQSGTLMPFSGELVHGAFLYWLKRAAPDVATWLHDGNKRRLFTCSSLQFPLATQRMLEAERNNVHLPLDPEKTYTLRITLLLGELFPLFHDALQHFNATQHGAKKPLFMQIGKQLFTLEEVIADRDDASGWTGFTSFATLADKAQTLNLGKVESVAMEFASLTTFNRANQRSQIYGGHYARLPLPQYVFPGLVRRWQESAPSELAQIVQMERVEQYIEDEGIIISDYDLKPHQVRFTTHKQPGFVGIGKYDMRGPDEEVTEEAPLTLRQQLWLLAQLAFYCGVGYKTAMGMGQVRPV